MYFKGWVICPVLGFVLTVLKKNPLWYYFSENSGGVTITFGVGLLSESHCVPKSPFFCWDLKGHCLHRALACSRLYKGLNGKATFTQLMDLRANRACSKKSDRMEDKKLQHNIYIKKSFFFWHSTSMTEMCIILAVRAQSTAALLCPVWPLKGWLFQNWCFILAWLLAN